MSIIFVFYLKHKYAWSNITFPSSETASLLRVRRDSSARGRGRARFVIVIVIIIQNMDPGCAIDGGSRWAGGRLVVSQ